MSGCHADPSRGTLSRIPSLDGLRAVSITVVLVGHLSGTRATSPRLRITETHYFDLAYFGVAVFFVISGYLITGLLLAEWKDTGDIRLSRFYFRRALRILPASGVYIAVAGALTLAGVLAIPARDFWHALTYTMNYASPVVAARPPLVARRGGAVLPALAIHAPARRSSPRHVDRARGSLRRPWFRLVEWSSPASLGSTFETTADALAMGCLFALGQAELRRREWYHRLVAMRWVAPALVTASVVLSLGPRSLALAFQVMFVHLAALAIVVRYVERPSEDVGVLLNSRPFIYVGTLSYLLYLWQQMFINRHSGAWTSAFPVDVGLAVLCAVASYYVVERPFLALRSRVEPRRSRSEPLLQTG